MKHALRSSLIALLAAACGRTDASAPHPVKPEPPPNLAAVRVEARSVETDHEGTCTVTFLVRNESQEPITFQGFEANMPTYTLEVLEDGRWETYATGWCGTGLLDFTLVPGGEMTFVANLPEPGKSYRAIFGDPKVVTPPVKAPGKAPGKAGAR